MNQKWTKKQLEASVKAYLDMRNKELRNEKFIKIEILKGLSKRFKRSRSSFEYRMQNISSIFQEWNEPWIKGFKPYSHIGKNVKEILVDLIKDHDPNSNKLRSYFYSTSSRLVSINAKNARSSKFKRTKKEVILQSNEDKLVQRYSKFLLESENIVLKKHLIDIAGENSTLETDGWIENTRTLLEAKYFLEGESPRQKIRMAIGQLHDYKRHLNKKPRSLAILLPLCPISDLVDLIHSQGIDLIYEEKNKFTTKKSNIII